MYHQKKKEKRINRKHIILTQTGIIREKMFGKNKLNKITEPITVITLILQVLNTHLFPFIDGKSRSEHQGQEGVVRSNSVTVS